MNDFEAIKHAANIEVVRKLLVQFFMNEGFESFDRLVFPPILAKLPIMVEQLSNKVEVVPYTMSLDPITGKAILGWNLFVLGTHMMFIGKTYHNDLQELAAQIRNGDMPFNNDNISASNQTTPKRIIIFITKVLGSHEDGYIDLRQTSSITNRSMVPKSMMTSVPQSNQYGSLS